MPSSMHTDPVRMHPARVTALVTSFVELAPARGHGSHARAVDTTAGA